MNEEKRKRSPNWLPLEKVLLLDLVEQHFSIVENKKTDGVSVKRKLAEWSLIAEKYNGQTSHCFRSAENLKAQWESMKKSAKQEESTNRIYRIKTGGGPPKPKKEHPVHTRIIGLIETTAIGLFNPFDCDSVVPMELAVNAPETQDLQPEVPHPSNDLEMHNKRELPIEIKENEYKTQDSEMQDKDWGDYTPQLLRTPVSAVLRPNDFKNTNYKKDEKESSNIKSWLTRRRPTHAATSSSLEQLHLKKIEALELQKKMACEERERAIETHNIDLEIKREMLKQARINTRILLLEAKLKKKKLQDL